jgi:hypothetical protein
LQVNFNLARKMLTTLFELLYDDDTDADAFEKLLGWIGILLNSHYTNFVMSKDEDTKNQLNAALAVVSQLESNLNLMGSTLPLIRLIAQKQSVRPAVSQKIYSIEIVDL